eukprot:TRINITY_DN8296_c1_g7_i1.p1 TRINITY_DN8296_c1_g7~~TRINITY_DN8296_c1_g7_i1.p1  ORF type:complete len:348 (+),score=31.17 TRINITY_DN8296_c1_g7_i1:54-1046(+)
MTTENCKWNRDASSYGFYPGTLFSSRMAGPPSQLLSAPPAEGSQLSSCTNPPTAEIGIPMPRFLGMMQQPSETQVHREYGSHTKFPAWETNYNDEYRVFQAGHADNSFRFYQESGRGQGLAATGFCDAPYLLSQGCATGLRSGHRDYVPRGLPEMHHLEKTYTTLEEHSRNSYYQRSSYPYSIENQAYRKEECSECDRCVVPLIHGRSQDYREDDDVLRKDETSLTTLSSLYPTQAIEKRVSGSLVNAGAVWHAGGRCIPCKFFRSKNGCKGGLSCEFCHYPHQELSRSQLRNRFKRANYKTREAVGACADSGGLPHVTDTFEEEQDSLQ